MCELAGFFNPIRFFVAVKLVALNNRFISFGANSIRDLAKLKTITNTITKLSSRFKGNAIDYKVIVDIVGAVVKRDSDIYQTAPTDNTIADIMAKSTFNSAVEIGNGENIITLSTCSYEFNNARYVVVGKLKKI